MDRLTNMENKEIYIDGVDVSECEYFSSGLGYCTIGLLADDGTHICECEQNCHYKQLKRKVQECEELKETLKTKAKGWANVNDKILEEVEQIRVENEKLKTALKFRDSSIDAKNKEILKKCKNNRELIDKNCKLIKTLTEIKDIVKQNIQLNI